MKIGNSLKHNKDMRFGTDYVYDSIIHPYQWVQLQKWFAGKFSVTALYSTVYLNLHENRQ